MDFHLIMLRRRNPLPIHGQIYCYLFDGQGLMPLRIPKLLFSVAVPPTPTLTFNASLNTTNLVVFLGKMLGANGEVGIFSITVSPTPDRMGVGIISPITRVPVGLENETTGNASIQTRVEVRTTFSERDLGSWERFSQASRRTRLDYGL
jgi:hypothetical protein